MSASFTLSASLYHRLIEECTSRTEQLLCRDRGQRLADGSVRFDLPDAVAAAIEEFMFEDEPFPDAIERLLAKAKGRIS